MGNFNAQPLLSAMKDIIKVNGIIKLINVNTCFKGQGSCNDIILTIPTEGSHLNTPTITKLEQVAITIY